MFDRGQDEDQLDEDQRLGRDAYDASHPGQDRLALKFGRCEEHIEAERGSHIDQSHTIQELERSATSGELQHGNVSK